MGRSADYTIQGFLYQFNQTLSELLKSDDDAIITIEGIVEDIEVKSYNGLKAIQCKYHETHQHYTPSILYHPLLQMMKHFKSNPNAEINYHLYAHFPNNPGIAITAVELNEALNSTNKSLKDLIKDVIGVNINDFLNKLTVSVTPKYDELMEENSKALELLGFNATEVETLYYPNAIQIIADLSIQHDENLRKIAKKDFLAILRRIRSTAISQWTLALRTRIKIMETRKKQLKPNLNMNTRLRHLIIFPTHLEQFDEKIVIFIKSFIDKYHFKAAHTQTPVIALDVTQDEFDLIGERLLAKEVIPNLGRPVKTFSEAQFFRDPLTQKDRKEFVLRLIRWSEYQSLSMKTKADDIFVIGDGNATQLDIRDINIERLGNEKLEEIKYIMGMSDVY